MFDFSVATWFPGGATISRPYISCTPAPHRTGQAAFPHPALHSDIRRDSYPCQVCAHRNLTPCIVPVFLPSRASECGNLHSTGISRFIAKPVPVPLRSRHLRAFFYVGPSYSGDIRPRASPHARIAPLLLLGSMLSETPGAREPLSYSAVSRMACALGQHDRQSPKLSRSRGYVSDSWHTPFTSPNSRCKCSSSGRLDRPCPERLLGCS